MRIMKKITFILNPISGTHSKEEIPELIEKTLDHDLYEHRIVFTEYAGHAAEIAREESKAGTDVVVAVGGDGTVNEVARSLVHTATALAIIPCSIFAIASLFWFLGCLRGDYGSQALGAYYIRKHRELYPQDRGFIYMTPKKAKKEHLIN